MSVVNKPRTLPAVISAGTGQLPEDIARRTSDRGDGPQRKPGTIDRIRSTHGQNEGLGLVVAFDGGVNSILQATTADTQATVEVIAEEGGSATIRLNVGSQVALVASFDGSNLRIGAFGAAAVVRPTLDPGASTGDRLTNIEQALANLGWVGLV